MTRGCLITLLLVFSVGCGGAPTAETTGSIDFTLERTIGRDVVLSYPRFVETLEDGTVLVADVETIHRFSPDGRQVGQFGSSGSGPGEFERLGMMSVTSSGEILTWDSHARRMTYWSESGEYLRSQPFSEPVAAMSILPGKSGYTLAYMTPPLDGETPNWLHEFGPELQQPVRHHTAYELSAFSEIDNPAVLSGPGFLAGVKDGYVWVPTFYDGQLVQITANGQEIVFPGMSVSGTLVEKVEVREDANMSVFIAGVKEGTHLRIRYIGDGLFSMPGGGLLHVVSVDSYRSNPDSRTEITLFDADLDVSATRSLTRADSLGTPLHVDDNGRLYTVRTEPEPHIAVWRVEYHAE